MHAVIEEVLKTRTEMIIVTAAMCFPGPICTMSLAVGWSWVGTLALVTMNPRLNGIMKPSIAGVFFKFSWTSGVVKVPGGWYIPRPTCAQRGRHWRDAKIIAKTTLAGRMFDFTKGATHYHDTYVRPRWETRQ